MHKEYIDLFDDNTNTIHNQARMIFCCLLGINASLWLVCLFVFYGRPLLLGVSSLAYSLGLRHAMDADHIAAIDNITRKLLHEGRKAQFVGLFFSLGHSTLVIFGAVAIAVTTTSMQYHAMAFHEMGGIVGTIISSSFLLFIAVANIFILRTVYQRFIQIKRGSGDRECNMDKLPVKPGLLSKQRQYLFALITRHWHMYVLGLLFAIGFDTVTEIGLMSIAANEAAKGLPIGWVLIFPMLFAAGMTLIDTTNNLLMLGVYHWALVKPIRKLYYNMTVTLLSVIVAVFVGVMELLWLIGDQFELTGGWWNLIRLMNSNSAFLGYLILGIFVLGWLIAAIIYRLKQLDR